MKPLPANLNVYYQLPQTPEANDNPMTAEKLIVWFRELKRLTKEEWDAMSLSEKVKHRKRMRIIRRHEIEGGVVF